MPTCSDGRARVVGLHESSDVVTQRERLKYGHGSALIDRLASLSIAIAQHVEREQ